ncbi:hypothetical protein BDA99DRAFT_510066 [Phascolomyces articulosus]|uniref:LysM domain-containing protein n=1 Tax=Phascolomyces articulosus TaxID=60185 RepID=A0AAD5K0G3_9FUNG|nr:hypothetical protein BDA99DRAFT_510066 [Phascolomyces articulosus]
MKFTLISAATLAIAGLVSAGVVPCQTTAKVDKSLSCAETAAQNGLSVDAFIHVNKFQTESACDIALQLVDSVCVDQKHSHTKRCLAEKKAAEKKAAEEKAAAEKKAAEEKAAQEEKDSQEKEQPAAPSGKGPSPNAIPASQAGSLRIVNKADENCTWYYVITAADSGCADVASKNGITANDLYNLNRNLHREGVHECDNLDDGKAYCVSTN